LPVSVVLWLCEYCATAGNKLTINGLPRHPLVVINWLKGKFPKTAVGRALLFGSRLVLYSGRSHAHVGHTVKVTPWQWRGAAEGTSPSSQALFISFQRLRLSLQFLCSAVRYFFSFPGSCTRGESKIYFAVEVVRAVVSIYCGTTVNPTTCRRFSTNLVPNENWLGDGRTRELSFENERRRGE